MFVLSQATVVDKLECPQSRAEGLTFYDFVEVGARKGMRYIIARSPSLASCKCCFQYRHREEKKMEGE
eukprot:scaffold69878_cov16-Tisochrysis_lutea.AAC.1